MPQPSMAADSMASAKGRVLPSRAPAAEIRYTRSGLPAFFNVPTMSASLGSHSAYLGSRSLQ